jgi:hypothetical protein
MSKKEDIPVIGRIIDIRVREIDHSFVPNTDNMTLEETIEHIKDMFEFDDYNKDLMNKMIEEVINNWNEKKDEEEV